MKIVKKFAKLFIFAGFFSLFSNNERTNKNQFLCVKNKNINGFISAKNTSFTHIAISKLRYVKLI